MSATTVPAEIADFAARVRAELADLPDEELEELTDGLEADLSEAYAEDLARELPDAAEYAVELRSAAGLPRAPEQRSGVRGAFASLADGLRDTGRDVAITLRRHPAASAVLDFAAVLRPAWWLVRAWVAVWLVSAFFGGESGFFPTSAIFFLLLLAALVTSVQWGRGQWGAHRIVPLLVLGNVAAAVLVVPVVVMADQSAGYAESYAYDDPYAGTTSQGITLGGTSVTNIYAYDAEGEPLTGVQLFDQSGQPLVPALDPARDECLDEYCTVDGDGRAAVPTTLVTGEEVGNVFPLSMVTYLFDELGQVGSTPATDAQVPTAPFVKVPALASTETDDEAGDGAADDGDGRGGAEEKVSPRN